MKKSVKTTPRKQKNSENYNSTTPPKQKKVNNEEDSSPKTPCKLFNDLSLVTNSSEGNDFSKTDRILEYNSYENAKKVLHSYSTEELVGREEELKEINNFILNNIRKKTSGSLYISGPPGTGKTASVLQVLKNSNVSNGIVNKINTSSTWK